MVPAGVSKTIEVETVVNFLRPHNGQFVSCIMATYSEVDRLDEMSTYNVSTLFSFLLILPLV